MKIIASVFGIGAMICLFLIYQQQERKKLLLTKQCADICWVLHYMCLGAVGGMIPNFVGIFREFIFMKREEKSWASSPVWLCSFILLGWVLGLRSFTEPINIMPIAASTAVTISLWLENSTLTKIVSVPVSATFLVYDILVGSYIGVVNETVSILSIIIFFIKRRNKNV